MIVKTLLGGMLNVNDSFNMSIYYVVLQKQIIFYCNSALLLCVSLSFG